jgi:Flp pilus assembly pilin Flp
MDKIWTQTPSMRHLFSKFLLDEEGQDLIEYTLLMAFVALASAALFLGSGGSISGIWSTTNNQLAQANVQSS